MGKITITFEDISLSDEELSSKIDGLLGLIEDKKRMPDLKGNCRCPKHLCKPWAAGTWHEECGTCGGRV